MLCCRSNRMVCTVCCSSKKELLRKNLLTALVMHKYSGKLFDPERAKYVWINKFKESNQGTLPKDKRVIDDGKGLANIRR